MFNPTRKYRPFLQLARAAGAPVERSLASVGLTEAQFLNSATRLPISSAVSLCDALAELCGVPDIGLRAAQHSQLPDLDVLGYLMKFSPTPLAALEQLAQYPRLVGDSAEFVVDVRGGMVAIRARVRGRRMLPVMADYTLGTLHRVMASMTEGLARLHEVTLPRPEPVWASKHERSGDAGGRCALTDGVGAFRGRYPHWGCSYERRGARWVARSVAQTSPAHASLPRR